MCLVSEGCIIPLFNYLFFLMLTALLQELPSFLSVYLTHRQKLCSSEAATGGSAVCRYFYITRAVNY